MNPLPNRHVQTIDEATDICFRHAGGNFKHRAQQVYRNAVDEAMRVYIDEDETRLFTRMTKDHTLIDNVIEAVRASIPMYRVLQKKKGDALYSIKDKNNEFEDLIWQSLIRNKIKVVERYGTRKIMKEFMASLQEANQKPSTSNKKSTVKRKNTMKTKQSRKKISKAKQLLEESDSSISYSSEKSLKSIRKRKQCHQGKQRKKIVIEEDT